MPASCRPTRTPASIVSTSISANPARSSRRLAGPTAYLHAHLALTEAALAKLKPYERGKRVRFRPNDRLLACLEALSTASDYAE
jgi:hypothetical protein